MRNSNYTANNGTEWTVRTYKLMRLIARLINKLFGKMAHCWACDLSYEDYRFHGGRGPAWVYKYIGLTLDYEIYHNFYKE